MRHTPYQQTPERRPRLLFLSYLFPPVTSIACVRTWNIAKYLARFGWDVTVVTPHPSLWRHTENGDATDRALQQEGIRRILTGHRWRCLTPDRLHCWNEGIGWLLGGICRRITKYVGIPEDVGWIKSAQKACARITPDDVDIILGTGSPFSTFHLAKILSVRLGRPYILDYRDPWTGNLHAREPDRPAVVQQEAALLKQSAAVTIVSNAWGLALDHRFGLGPKLHIITNGYDQEELRQVEPFDFGHFAIVYTGTFYPPKRVISPVMAALQRLKAIDGGGTSLWYLHYYGDQADHVQQEAGRFGVMDRVILHGQVSRSEALAAVRGAGVAVVITSVAEKGTLADRGMVTGKLYETIGLNTPVLLIAPHGSDAAEILANREPHASFLGSDVEGICGYLRQLIHGAMARPHSLPPQNYAWPTLARRFDKLLRSYI